MAKDKTINDRLIAVQGELRAPKNQQNKFGRYNYRSCEDILEAVKPLCAREGLLLTISDELIQIGTRYYVRATAGVSDGKDAISTQAFAREEESRKGMDGSQITGSASSYARKYALNGLFLIDDSRDADTMPPVERTKRDAATILKDVAKSATAMQIPAGEITAIINVHYNKQNGKELTAEEAADLLANLKDYHLNMIGEK